jgi:hypothetical protein
MRKPVTVFSWGRIGTGFSFALGQIILEPSRVQQSVNLRHQKIDSRDVQKLLNTFLNNSPNRRVWGDVNLPQGGRVFKYSLLGVFEH